MRAARAALAGLALSAPAGAAEWADVAALFQERCVVCHSGEFAPNGLSLETHETVMTGSWMGAVVVQGDPASSKLIGRVKGEITPRMPLDGPPYLEDSQVALLENWIATGAFGGDAPEIAAEPEDVRRKGEIWFQDVEPFVTQRCVKCHSDGSILGAPPEGRRLSFYEAMIAGGERLVIVPGNATASKIWRHVAGLETPRMPFDGPPWLDDDQIALIAAWINGGTRDAEGAPAPVPVGGALRLEGILTDVGVLDGVAFRITPETRVEDGMVLGTRYELRAILGDNGAIMATR
jgi:mono/diheme cytochrome c family protein